LGDEINDWLLFLDEFRQGISVYLSILLGFLIFLEVVQSPNKLVGEFLGLSQLQIFYPVLSEKGFFCPPFFWPHMDADTKTSQRLP